MSEQNPKTITKQQIIAKAMKDEAFGQRLLSNPKEALEGELGITLPQEITIHVHQDTPTAIHLVLPMQPPTGEPRELSDAELAQAYGGAVSDYMEFGHSIVIE